MGNEFTGRIVYSVTAADGSQALHTVKAPASSAAILSFGLPATDNPGLETDAAGTIREDLEPGEVPLPKGISRAALNPRIEVSPAATASPSSFSATGNSRAEEYPYSD